jgi:hypothetical protein
MRAPVRVPIIDAMATESSEIRLILLIDLDADAINGSLEAPSADRADSSAGSRWPPR